MSVLSKLPFWAAPPRGYRQCRGTQRVSFSLTVDYPDAVRVRRALMQEAPPAFEVLECRVIPRTQCARLRIVCDAARADDVMHRVMHTVDAAEFGPLSLA